MDLSELQQMLIKFTESEDFKTLESFRDELLNSRLKDFGQFVKFNTETYCSNTLFRNEKFEIRLLCWKPLQKTVMHAHPENGCLMKILEGELNEEKHIGSTVLKNNYKKGDVSYTKTSELHTLRNMETDSVSLHIYSPSGFYDNTTK